VKLDVFQCQRSAANRLGRRIFELRDVGLQRLFLMRAVTATTIRISSAGNQRIFIAPAPPLHAVQRTVR
jgi:hypothetical protein